MLKNEKIARVCHEANRAICEANEDLSQFPWPDAPTWQKDSAMRGVEWALANPHAPAAAQHEAWLTDKIRDGWVYGPVKDATKKTHPCIVPYNALSFAQRVKDHVFQAIVKSLSD